MLTKVYIDDLASWCRINYALLDNDPAKSLGSPLTAGAELYVAGVPVGKTLNIPDSVTNISQCAFYGWTNITSVTMANSVTNIGAFAFGACSKLSSVTISDGAITIGEGAFLSCSAMNTLTLGKHVQNIGNEAFSGCSSLTGIDIPDSVRSIGRKSFRGCSSLACAINLKNVTSIGAEAFSYSALEEIFMSCTVESIGDYAFTGCNSLSRVVFAGAAPSVGSRVFYGVKSGCTAYVPWGSTGWNVPIPGTWNGINIAYLFAGRSEVAEADLPETVAVQSGADVTVTVDHDMLVAQLKALIARFFAMPRGSGQNADYFKVTGSYDAVKGSVLVKVVIDADKIGLERTMAETVSADALASFKADGSMRLTNVKDGFYYGLAAVERLEDMDEAVESAKASGLVRAENGEVSVSAERPTGGSAFFKIIVSDNAQGEE